MNMGFSWKQAKIDAIATQIRRAKTMALKSNPNTDFQLQHPDWIREAQSNNFTQLTKQITEKVKARQKLAEDRKLRTHARRKD